MGRRVSLLAAFRKACQQLKINCTIIGTDVTDLSAALQCCDVKKIVAPIDSPKYRQQLFALIKEHNVDLLIPTVDLDLPLWSKYRDKLLQLNCTPLISSEKVIATCLDKRKTYKALLKLGLDAPDTFTPKNVLASKVKQYPYILKPWDGHASRAIHIANNKRELEFFSKYIPHCMVQTLVRGEEFTVDVLVDFDMNIRSVVPRKRIQVRGGEVSKGITVKHQEIIKQSTYLVNKLGAGPGVITLQCFLTDQNEIKFIEINPRFGGGILLSIEAGANFPKWIIQLLMNKKPRIAEDAWKENLTMLRYDDAVWMHPNK